LITLAPEETILLLYSVIFLLLQIFFWKKKCVFQSPTKNEDKQPGKQLSVMMSKGKE